MAGEGSGKELRSADHLKRLTAERSRQNRIRTVLGGGVFALFLLFAITIAQQFRSVDSARLEVKMNARASASLWPIVSEELDALTPKVLPPLDAAFRAESPRYLPRLIQHLDVEMERFEEDLEEQGDQLIEDALSVVMEAHSKELAAIRDSLSDDPVQAERAYAAVMERARGWARAELDHVFQEEDAVFERLHQSVRTAAEETPAGESLGDLLMNLIVLTSSNNGRGD